MDKDVAGMLHNKDCPHGHKCLALDCMECMVIYESEAGE